MRARTTEANRHPRTAAANPRPHDLDAIRADIEHTRAELGDILHELASRMDLKARAKARAQRTFGEIADSAAATARAAGVRARAAVQHAALKGRQRSASYAAVAAGAVAVVAAVVLIHRGRTASARRWWSE